MEHENIPVKLVDFVVGRGHGHQPMGVLSKIVIPKVILSLRHHILKSAAKGLAKFYVQERLLYAPLQELLADLLPNPAVVDIEAPLKLLSNRSLKTDISIRHLAEVERDRLDPFLSFCFIEMKTVFFGESISKKDILSDIEKLVECKVKYKAKCFFVLIGLESELNKSPTALGVFGNLENDINPIEIDLQNKKVWLQPAGRSTDNELRIFVWGVSDKKAFPMNSMSCSYTIFQAV